MTLKLGKNMVDIAIGYGKLQHNFWCSNLTVAKTGNRITSVGFLDKDGNFEAYPECGSNRSVYVVGFSDQGYHATAVANLMRLVCFLIKDKVDDMIGRPEKEGRNSFTNGGGFENGGFVEEAIIYTPYLAHSGLSEYQAIFSMFPVYNDSKEWVHRRPKNLLSKEDRWIDGIRLQEDGSPRKFSNALGTLDVRLESKLEMEWVMKNFGPEDKQPQHAEYAISTNFSDVMQYVNTVAQLIFLNYFNGKSYQEKRAEIREQVVKNVNYEKCGLYMHKQNLSEYYVYPAGYSGSVNIYHAFNTTDELDKTINIKDLLADYFFLEGREFMEGK